MPIDKFLIILSISITIISIVLINDYQAFITKDMQTYHRHFKPVFYCFPDLEIAFTKIPNLNKPASVKIPTLNGNIWMSIEHFNTKKEAIKYVQKYFGADSEGKISLISED